MISQIRKRIEKIEAGIKKEAGSKVLYRWEDIVDFMRHPEKYEGYTIFDGERTPNGKISWPVLARQIMEDTEDGITLDEEMDDDEGA